MPCSMAGWCSKPAKRWCRKAESQLYVARYLSAVLDNITSIHHNFLPFVQFGINPSGNDMGIDDAKDPTDKKNSFSMEGHDQ